LRTWHGDPPSISTSNHRDPSARRNWFLPTNGIGSRLELPGTVVMQRIAGGRIRDIH
jgi:hypothetical protein